jgi:hypothetical protein
MSKFIKIPFCSSWAPFLYIRIGEIAYIIPSYEDGVFHNTRIGLRSSDKEYCVKETPEEIIKLIEEKS